MVGVTQESLHSPLSFQSLSKSTPTLQKGMGRMMGVKSASPLLRSIKKAKATEMGEES